jgi:AAA15 family ATPase/GTPase
METKHLSYFKVENFKRFDSLEVNDIGQFNLIVGDNNAGKTSLLEALLFDDENYDQLIHNLRGALKNKMGIDDSDLKDVNFLDFYLGNQQQPISFSLNRTNGTITECITLQKRTKDTLNEDEIKQLTVQIALAPSTDHLIEFSNGQKKALYFVTKNGINNVREFYPLAPININYSNNVANTLSEVIKSTRKLKEIVEQLRFFIPKILNIEVSNAIVPNEILVAIREEGNDLIKPINQYGDGVNKLFHYTLEFNLSENGHYMIDEIDSGIHYSRMKEFLIKIIQTAKNKNVQLFATTHSKECLEYYTQALQELGYEKEGRIIRIANTKSGIKAYTMRFEEFENALEADSEIR